MIKGKDKLLFKKDKHIGAVKALDFNNFQVTCCRSYKRLTQITIARITFLSPTRNVSTT